MQVEGGDKPILKDSPHNNFFLQLSWSGSSLELHEQLPSVIPTPHIYTSIYWEVYEWPFVNIPMVDIRRAIHSTLRITMWEIVYKRPFVNIPTLDIQMAVYKCAFHAGHVDGLRMPIRNHPLVNIRSLCSFNFAHDSRRDFSWTTICKHLNGRYTKMWS